MTTQPKALHLADALRDGLPYGEAEIENELRRLHAELERCKQVCAATAEGWRVERAALLGALKQVEPILARMYGAQAAQLPPMQTVRAAIAKAEENA